MHLPMSHQTNGAVRSKYENSTKDIYSELGLTPVVLL